MAHDRNEEVVLEVLKYLGVQHEIHTRRSASGEPSPVGCDINDAFEANVISGVC